ncbi:hypothetical protein JD974_04225 [Chromobacterium haemolyticum]|uniref:Uncharacterized protein n=1 Tax=Chromobacterium haemolyticum TaxID=394935 RepID=A0ABS3GJE2_9NEIS|nr:hypothetical protein [Chromobacterium haemolyticum]MBK0413607.1 hypothetical protein [Chromobacterium haemolyticum]MBO0414709.1 hypothetical protein [Chromobacterium haemolyticum]MBO0497970.1 hypothetical protein [Chromobacterium haemolyticum]
MAPTHKQIAAGQRRSLLAMQRKLQDMAAQWGDLDAYNEGALADLAEKIGNTAGDLIEKD